MKTFDLRFDPESRRYPSQDVHAVLKHLEGGEYVPVACDRVQFNPQKDGLLDIGPLRTEEHVVIAPVGVRAEAMQRADFLDQIREPVELKVSALPRPGAGGAVAEVIDACLVRIHPPPKRLVVLQPTPAQLPWPARADNRMTVELQILGAADDKPVVNTMVSLERRASSKPKAGDFDAQDRPPKATDDQGRVSFTYTPPDLTYEPGGAYLEEFAVFTGPAESREEVGRLKLPLAPLLSFKVEMEKVGKVDEQPYGLEFKPQEVELVLGPELQVATVKVTAFLADVWDGVHFRFPVGYARAGISVKSADDWKRVFAIGYEPTTGSDGVYAWKLPELQTCFPAPAEYDMEARGKPVESKLDTHADETACFYDTKLRDYCPTNVITEGLAQQLKSYRRTFCSHMASRDPKLFPDIDAASQLLCAATTHTRIFNNLYNQEWGRVSDLCSGTFGDVFQLAVTLLSVGDKFVKEFAPQVGRWFKQGIEWLSSLRYVKRFVDLIQHYVIGNIRKLCGVVDDMIGFLSTEAKGTRDAIVSRARAFVSEVKRALDDLVMTTCPEHGTTEEALLALRQWFERAVGLIVAAVGNAMKVMGELLRGLMDWVVEKIGKWYAPHAPTLDPVFEEYITPMRKWVAEQIGEFFHSPWHELDDVSLSKMVEIFIQWVNEKLNLTGGAGDWSGQKFVSSLVIMYGLSERTLGRCLHKAAELDAIPTPPRPKLDTFRDYVSSIREGQHQRENFQASTDEILSHLDNVITCIELIVLLVGSILSLGGAALIAETFNAVEVGFGAFKLALVRVPQGIGIMIAAFTIAYYYSSGTAALMEKTA